MEALTDRIRLFSAALALIYEPVAANFDRDAVKRALCELLRADDLVFTATGEVSGSGLLHGGGDGLRDPSAAQGAFGPHRSAKHVLSLDITDRGYDKLGLLVLRNASRVPFSESDLEWLSLLRPHLQKAEFVRGLMPEGIYGCAAGCQLVHSASEGLLITDSDSEILWLNRSARDILAAAQGLTTVNGRLCAGRAFETARIELLARQASLGGAGVMLVGNASMWLPYGLVFTPLAPESGLTAPGPLQRRQVLVTIKDMRRHISVIVGRLADVFGLTKAEQQVGALLLTGYSLKTIAKMTGKSLTTVKKQLRSMLTKTGSHTQAELLSMFLSVPSIV